MESKSYLHQTVLWEHPQQRDEISVPHQAPQHRENLGRWSVLESKKEAVLQKIKEWVLSVQLERRYTKNEIIAMYLNIYDFGYNFLRL